MAKIDITSSAIEKGIDLAKDFLGKLVVPAIEETGLLLKDKVTFWKFKNQVKILNKAKEYCEKHKITPKAISLKLMCPLLDYAALEEDEVLQDKWAILLSNMVDSKQNIENHVFPYLLSQISTNEFLHLELVVKMKSERLIKLNTELKEFKSSRPKLEQSLRAKIEKVEQKREENKKSQNHDSMELWQEKWNLEKEIRELDETEIRILNSIKEPEFIPYAELEEYEISNLIRLGLIKSVARPYAYVDQHSIRNHPHQEYLELEDLEIQIEHEHEDYTLTELGDLFIEACNLKSENIL